MRRVPITTLNDLMAERQTHRDATHRPVWDTAVVGLGMIDDVYDQFITQVMQSSGFIWGKGIWGVDEIDGETSGLASKYGLN